MADLFETAGFIDPASISKITKEELHSELSKANEMLRLVDQLPTLEMLSSWQSHFIEEEEVAVEEVETISGPETAIARELKPVPRALSVATAIPLSVEFVESHELELSSLPIAEIVDDEVLELRKHISARDQHIFKAPTVSPESPVEPKKRELDINRVQTFEEFREKGGNVEPLERSSELDLTKTPKAANNLGLSSTSRRYLRGVLHKEPGRTLVGSIAFIVSQVLLILAAVPIIYILSSPDDYMWGLLSPLLLVAAGLVYVTLARQVSCPVCRQRQYVSKDCRKHLKAHTMPIFGHMLPTALHVLLFKWFHCIFCGTSIRVKE